MKKISSRLIAAAVVVAAGASASAEVLSPEEALGRALPQARHAAPALVQPVLAFTAEADQQPAVYVFAKENKGFLVVSADDAVTPLLGYTDNGNFDADNMAPALRYWLDEYARQIAFARENGGNMAFITRPERSAIAPLVKTNWDQMSPYNLLCPSGRSGKMPTGCVATAAAQIMKYHQWPEHGNGTFAYTANIEGTPTNLSINLDETPFHWSLMLDKYNSTATEAQRLAVAELMIAIGYGVQMSYDSAGSGAQTVMVSKILAENFDYDKSVTYVQRDCYTLNQWEDLIYGELAAARPVLLDGSTINNEGHAFVCDGYDKDGYFHINWGWGGQSDGYFLLGTLDPDTQGTGGASSGAGFDYNQDATINIMPNQGGEAVPSITASGNGLVITGSTPGQFNLGRDVTVSYAGGGFYNHNWPAITPKFGLHIVGEGQDFYRWTGAAATEISTNYGRISYTVLLSGVKSNSKYVLTPAYKVGNNIYEMGMPYGQTRAYLLTTQSSTGVLTPIGNNITVTDLNVPEYFENRKNFTVSANLVNESDTYFYGHIAPAFFTKTYGEYEVFKLVENFTVNLDAAESQEWSKTFRFTSTSGFTANQDYYFGLLKVRNGGSYSVASELKKIHYGKPAGINDVTADNTIAVITPNPADSYFTVQGVEVSSVKVYSLTGSLVAAAAEATVDVANLAEGLYIVEVVDVEGNHTTARLIKK